MRLARLRSRRDKFCSRNAGCRREYFTNSSSPGVNPKVGLLQCEIEANYGLPPQSGAMRKMNDTMGEPLRRIAKSVLGNIAPHLISWFRFAVEPSKLVWYSSPMLRQLRMKHAGPVCHAIGRAAARVNETQEPGYPDQNQEPARASTEPWPKTDHTIH